MARRLTHMPYVLTENKDFAKNNALEDQIQRAAVSVMSNSSEGFERRTQHLLLEYLGREKASAGEVRAQPYVALDGGFIPADPFDQGYAPAAKAARQLHGLMRYPASQPSIPRVRGLPEAYGQVHDNG